MRVFCFCVYLGKTVFSTVSKLKIIIITFYLQKFFFIMPAMRTDLDVIPKDGMSAADTSYVDEWLIENQTKLPPIDDSVFKSLCKYVWKALRSNAATDSKEDM